MNEEKLETIVAGHNVEFYPSSHTYYVDGQETMSATQVTSFINPFRKRKIPIKVLEKAGKKGTIVHNAIEKFINEGVIGIDVEAKEWPYFKAFLDFYEQYKGQITFDQTEKQAIGAIDGVRIIGTIDIIGTFNDRPVILDWKTSAAITLPEWRLQLTLYKFFIQYTFGIDDCDVYIVWLKKNGTFELVKIQPFEFGWIKLIYRLLDKKNQDIINRFNMLLFEIFGGE